MASIFDLFGSNSSNRERLNDKKTTNRAKSSTPAGGATKVSAPGILGSTVGAIKRRQNRLNDL
jgi:hypothetical protein